MCSAPGLPLTAGHVLTLSELRHFERVSSLRSAVLVARCWVTIAAAMIVHALWPSAVTLMAASTLLIAKGYRPRMEIAASYANVIRRVTSAR